MKNPVEFISISRQCLLAMVLLLPESGSLAQILSEDYAAGAEPSILQNEIDIFSSMEEGVKLAVAECELLDSCSADVNREELDQIITTINSRINDLSIRYTDSGETALENVLVSYVDIRDGYQELLDKMESMPQFAVEEQPADEFTPDAFFSFGPVSNEVSPEIQQLYEDADEQIVDDAVNLDEEAAPPQGEAE